MPLMKIAALLLLLLAPALAGAQANHPSNNQYQSPAMVAKRLKAQCGPLPPQQRQECESKARAEVRASIDRHHEFKRAEAGARKQSAKAPGGFPKADRKGPQPIRPATAPK